MKPAALALTLSLTACYGAAPPRPPKIPLPPIQDGAAIDVYSQTKTDIENVQKQAQSCPAGHPEACVTTTYSEAEPVTRTTTTATYADAPITYAQFKVMTDPKYDEKLTELEDLSHKCTRANVPRYAGMGLMLGGLISGLIVKGGAGQALIYGGLAAGAGSYTLGYFAFGGRDCVAAKRLYEEVDVSAAMHWNSVQGADYATEMKSLADQFNASHARRASASLEMRHR